MEDGSMKDIAFSNSTRDSFCNAPRIAVCSHQCWDIFNAMAEWAVSEAGGKDRVFGTKPGVAEFTETDLGTEAGRAVSSNLRNMPEIQALLERILPGYGEMVAQGSKNTMSLLRGELPPDVQAAVQRSAAFKSLQGGYAGSGMSKALTARDIGRTSLDLMGEGTNAASRWAGLTQASVAPFTVTAPAQAAQTERNNLYKQATEQMKMNVLAAPDPGAAGIFNLQTAMGSMAASFGMSSALNGMGGGQQQQRLPQQQPTASGTATNTGAGMGGWTWGSYGG